MKNFKLIFSKTFVFVVMYSTSCCFILWFMSCGLYYKNIMKIVSDIRKCSLHYKWAISLAFPNCGVTNDHHLQSSSVYKTHFGSFLSKLTH